MVVEGFNAPAFLTPFHLYVLLHLRKAGVDYVRMMARMTGLDVETLQTAVDDLLEAGLIERDPGSAIKRSKARFKKAFEVHKHHTYYRLSRRGELFVRSINRRWIREYFETLLGPGGFAVVVGLFEARSGRIEGNNEKLVGELEFYHLLSPSGRRTRFFNVLCGFLMEGHPR